MKNKFLRVLGLAAVCAGSLTCFAGCTAQEVRDNTSTAIEASTSLMPVEYSESLAKTVYASAVTNSKLQKSMRLTADLIDYADDLSIEDMYRNRKTYTIDFSTSNMRSAYYKDDTNKPLYTVKIGDDYYHFDSSTKTYQIYDSGNPMDTFDTAFGFDLFDKVTGGMCYNNANSILSIEVANASKLVTVKNNLITNVSVLFYRENGPAKQITLVGTMSYEYNVDTTDDFKDCPNTVADIARLGYTLAAD